MQQPSGTGTQPWRQSKLLAGAEVALAALIVVGVNVFKIRPNIPYLNEVPIIFVLGWIFLRLHGESWHSVGLRQPDSWPRTVAIALAAGILIPVLRTLTEALVTYLTHLQPLPSSVEPAAGNLPALGLSLLVTWTFAAFGEELVYRAYLFTRLADLGNGTPLAWGLSLVAASVLFGLGHFYQGLPGVVGGFVSGLILGGLYLYGRRNLWICILAHGLADTLVFLLLFLNVVN